MSSRLAHHLPRMRHQLGQRLRLGDRSFRVRGYLANRQTTSLAHEPHLQSVLRRAMERFPGPMIDVGVNTGQTLLRMLSIDANRVYFGFEPQVGCCFCVNQFLTDNDLERATVLPMALSDRNGMLCLHARGQYDEMASAESRPGTEPFFVVSRVGDEVLSELGVKLPGVIKIDVEGAEIDVLNGLRRTLGRARPAVLFEVLPNFKGEDRIYLPDAVRVRNRSRAAQIHDLLTSLGYRVEQIDSDGRCTPVEGFDLDDRVGFIGRDYVAWPEEVLVSH